MRKSRFIVPVAAALLMGVSLASFAAGNGGGGGGGGGGHGGDHSSDRGSEHSSAGKSEQRGGSDDAKGAHDKHHAGTDKDSAKGKRTAADQLAAHPKLADRLAQLTGKTPAELQAAAAGFKNFGQFTAAAHVSHNLGLSFDDLKAEMNKDGGSLGKAIKTLSPKSNPDAEETKANKQAQDDLKQAS